MSLEKRAAARVSRSALSALVSTPSAQSAACVLGLLAVNAFVCRELFTTEYSEYLGSIEGAYIGLSRWISEHPWELRWFPLWYGGIPFQNAYPPLLHVLVAGFAGLTGASVALSHHAVTAFMYCLGPVTLFWLAKALSGQRLRSFAAALVYSLVSPSALLFPAIATDLGTRWGPRRLQALVRYGDGPHIMALTLLPLAVLALHAALSRRRPVPVYLAAAALAAVVLTNWIGAFALAVAVFCYLLATFERSRFGRPAAAVGIALLAYALASPWIPPSTVAAVSRNAQHVVGSFPLGVAQVGYGALVIVASVLLCTLLRRGSRTAWLRFCALFLLVTGAITLGWALGGVYLVPQPSRYHLEFEMASALIVAFGTAGLAGKLSLRTRTVGLTVCLLLAATQVANYRSYARRMIRPTEIEATVEYQAARWLDENLPGARVFATGSTQFWLNAFSDSPQLGGGFQPGVGNQMIHSVAFGVPYVEDDGLEAAKWLRSFGVEAIVVGGPRSRSAYRDYRDPDKFRGVFPELWRSDDDVIYAVPEHTPAPARAIRSRHLVDRAPIYAVDIEPVDAYDDALQQTDLPVAELLWLSPHRLSVTAALEPGQLLSVQVSHHPGWRASVAGRPREVRRDELGLIVVAPGCDGVCTVDLVYDGGLEMRLAELARGSSVLAGLVWLGGGGLVRRRPKEREAFDA